jgi:hypothetical protein
MSEMVLALFVLCAAACASTTSTVPSPPQQPGPNIAQYTITPAPTTVAIALDDSSRDKLVRRLGAGSLVAARLTLRDMRATGAQTLKGVRIFVEKPDADLDTPSSDPHYAGSFVLGFTPSETLNLNIAPALAAIWKSGGLTSATLNDRQAVRVTFVPEPWEPARRMPPEFSLTIQSVELILPQS